MKLVSINQQLLEKYSADPEILRKSGRPCVLLIRLKYKDRNQNFAVPLRSNIPASAPKNQYFPLPPRSSTRPGNRHGIHYIKMFPVINKYLVKYRTDGNAHAQLIQDVIQRNEKRIVEGCQAYLDSYASGNRPEYATNLELLFSLLASNAD